MMGEFEMINIQLGETQAYLDWFKQKLYLNSKAPRAKFRMVKRGDVYWCDLGKGVGSEESEKRPCVILQHDAINRKSPNTFVAPITHASSELSYVIPIEDKFDQEGNLILDGHVLLGNMVSVSKGRLGDLITSLTPEEMKKVDESIAYVTNIYHYYETTKNILKDQEDHIERLKQKVAELQNELKDLKRK